MSSEENNWFERIIKHKRLVKALEGFTEFYTQIPEDYVEEKREKI